MYYVIETNYAGPNHDQHADADIIEISTAPAITNSSHEVRIEGWCGTTNDWAVYAHGEYASAEEARAAIAEKFGDVRDSDPNGERFEEQRMLAISRLLNSERGMAYQVCKKVTEGIDLPTTERKVAELLGAINYIAGMVIFLREKDGGA